MTKEQQMYFEKYDDLALVLASAYNDTLENKTGVIEYYDLCQAGLLGLIKACKSFNKEKYQSQSAEKFYFSRAISRAIQQEVHKEKSFSFDNFEDIECISSEELFSDDEEVINIMARYQIYEEVSQELLVGIFKEVLKTLTEREEKVVKLYFGFETRPHSFREVGEELNISRSRAWEVFNRAMRKLRHPIRSRLFKDFL